MQIKIRAAITWCKNNNYTYMIISNDWFVENARKIDYSIHDPKIKKGMKQFFK
jgi:hypothetical protein